MFLFLGWYYKLANVLWNIAGGPHTFPLPGQETLQVAQWSAWFRLGKWVGSRRVYIYTYIYTATPPIRMVLSSYIPFGMCSWAAVVSYHTDARVTLSGKNTQVYPSLTNIYPRGAGFQTYWHSGIKKNTCWIMLVLFGDFIAVEFYPCHSVLHVCVAHMSSWMGIRYTQQPPVTLDNGPFLDDEAMVIFQ